MEKTLLLQAGDDIADRKCWMYKLQVSAELLGTNQNAHKITSSIIGDKNQRAHKMNYDMDQKWQIVSSQYKQYIFGKCDHCMM